MSDSTALAAFVSSVLSATADPVVAAVGGLFGMAASRWWHRILGAVVLAFVLTLAISVGRDAGGDLPTWSVVLSRTIALIIWTTVGALARWGVDNIQGR